VAFALLSLLFLASMVLVVTAAVGATVVQQPVAGAPPSPDPGGAHHGIRRESAPSGR
jgi:hypothetical protein